MGKRLWVIGGSVCVALGILGILLPILPTTPFLLLAAFCYGRGSERFYNWLLDRSRFGSYIRNYREGRGIPIKQKLATIALLWLTISFTIVLVEISWWLKALLVIVAVGVTIHLSKVTTWRRESPGSAEKGNSTEAIESTGSFSMGADANQQ